VILVETKKGAAAGGPSIAYDTYVAAASPAGYLNLVTADQYRQFVGQQVPIFIADTVACPHPAAWSTPPASIRPGAGSENSSPAGHREYDCTGRHAHLRHAQSRPVVLRRERRHALSRVAQLHEPAGVSLANGLERIQGRLTATHKALDNRMRWA